MPDHVRKVRSALSRRGLLGLGAATIALIIHGSRSAVGQRSGRTVSAKPRDHRALRKKSISNLKEIGLAMHKFHDAHGHFPPAALTDSAGEPLLSWRVAILPYLGYGDLYKRFKSDEPWDGPFNRKLLSEMPEVYTPVDPGTKPKHETFYRGFIGGGAFFEGDEGIKIVDITDGTVNTLMLVEAAEPIAWTKPEELPLEDGRSLPGLGGQFEDGFHALTCDGWVHFLDKKIDADLLRWAIARDDGEVIKLARMYRTIP
jgi:hypothetical protein